MLYLLVTGSPLLEKSLSSTQNIPLGNLLTWMGMIALPLSIYWGSKGLRQPDSTVRKYLSVLLKCLILLALLWVPICYLLAGNIAFNFSGTEEFQGGQIAMKWFWRYSYGLPIVTIGVLLAYWITTGIRRMGRNS